MPTRATRRGRLPAAERGSREEDILDAALAELVDAGPAGLSMSKVAERAGASKETLYSWFASREGLLEALIRRNADATADRVRAALEDTTADPRGVLVDFVDKLLTLLVSPSSIALNRAAMASDTVAKQLLRSGRHRVGPLVEAYLTSLHTAGVLDVSDPAAAFELLYGLAIRDLQIRVLLGEPAPSKPALTRRANEAVGQFFQLRGSQH